jgi:hypothetical protein
MHRRIQDQNLERKRRIVKPSVRTFTSLEQVLNLALRSLAAKAKLSHVKYASPPGKPNYWASILVSFIMELLF